MSFRQPVEVRLKHVKKSLRLEIEVPWGLVSKDRRIRRAIAGIVQAGGLWWSNIFISWDAILYIRPLQDAGPPESNDGKRNE